MNEGAVKRTDFNESQDYLFMMVKGKQPFPFKYWLKYYEDGTVAIRGIMDPLSWETVKIDDELRKRMNDSIRVKMEYILTHPGEDLIVDDRCYGYDVMIFYNLEKKYPQEKLRDSRLESIDYCNDEMHNKIITCLFSCKEVYQKWIETQDSVHTIGHIRNHNNV